MGLTRHWFISAWYLQLKPFWSEYARNNLLKGVKPGSQAFSVCSSLTIFMNPSSLSDTSLVHLNLAQAMADSFQALTSSSSALLASFLCKISPFTLLSGSSSERPEPLPIGSQGAVLLVGGPDWGGSGSGLVWGGRGKLGGCWFQPATLIPVTIKFSSYDLGVIWGWIRLW